MKLLTLFAKSLAFCALLCLCIFLLNLAHHNIVVKDLAIYRNFDQFDTYKDQTTTYVFGDSHAVNDIDVRLMSNTFNFAIQGEAMDQTLHKVRYVVENQEVDTIILPADPHILADYRANKYVYLWYWSEFMPLGELAELTRRSIPATFVLANFPVLGNGLDFMWLFSRTELTPMYKGFQELSGSIENLTESQRLTKAQERADSQFNGNAPSDDLSSAFTSIIELADKNNINVILVKFPLTPEYAQAALSHTEHKDEVEQLLQDALEFDNVLLVDYQNYYTDYSVFADMDHLHAQAAKDFTQMLIKDIGAVS